MHRVLLLLALLLAAGARPVRAQGGMPDMSKAPREIQAIWKKVMSGGIPSQAEAKKLQDYMAGQRDQIVAGAKASAAAAAKMADSVKGANAAAAPADATAQCPARSPALATVASVAPSPAAAARLLDSLRQSYTAQESTAGQQHLRQLMQKARTAPALDFMGSMLAAANKAGASVVVYAAAAQLGGATARASWSGLGAALELAGDDPHAVPAFRRALAIGPRAATDVYGLGVAYANMGDMATGIPLLTEATRLAPKFGMAWDALGRAQSCTGAIKIAVASMQKAQEVDWIESREAQVSGPESNDDKIEAQKPLPEPPAVSLTPPPSPPPFPFQVPSIPGTWQAAKHFGTEMLGVAGEYRGMQTGIAPREQAAEDAARKEMEAAEARAGLAGAMLFDMNIDNSRDVYQATDRVDQRVAGRKSLIMASYNDQSMRLVKQAAARGAA
ncbi:MAG TPA: hypothetical protein VFT41_03355, partial [Gemmatimonadaceae bacterium]|nr:hypothetical protein [Gemmatimonadaceae bacterium]